MALNALSAALGWIVHNRVLDTWATLIVAFFAISNALIGMWLAWRLIRDEPPAPPQAS